MRLHFFNSGVIANSKMDGVQSKIMIISDKQVV